MTISKNNFKKLAVSAARAGDSKKASPVRVYDLTGRSPLADYAVLLTVESGPQLDAVEDEVLGMLKQEGAYCLHKDGMQSKNWKVLDYGGVLVHIYDAKAEEFYSIGKVFADYKPVEWEEASAPKPAAPVKEAAKKTAGKKAAPKRAKPAKKAAAGKTRPAAKKAAPKRAKPAKKAAAGKTRPAAKKKAAKKKK